MYAVKKGIQFTVRVLTLASRPLGLVLVVSACTSRAYAFTSVPEIDPGSMATVLVFGPWNVK